MKIRDAPTRVKKGFKQFVNKLVRLGVSLDENGNADFSNVKSDKVIKELTENITLVKLALMEKDLEFEYPHKLGKILTPMDRPAPFPEIPKPALTYEQYYGLEPMSIASALHWNRGSRNFEQRFLQRNFFFEQG